MMTEDIVERRSWRRNITLSPEAVDAALTNMQRMENEIESLRAQLATEREKVEALARAAKTAEEFYRTEHALGFKAGIEAGADAIGCIPRNCGCRPCHGHPDRDAAYEAAVDAISALSPPCSPRSEGSYEDVKGQLIHERPIICGSQRR